MEKYDNVMRVKRQIESGMLAQDGVHGISVGEDKARPGEFCIYLHVEPGMPSDIIPAEVEGVKIAVSVEKITDCHLDTGSYRPLLGGCQIETVDVGPGTLGCIVKDRRQGKICVLSNQHILGHAGKRVGQPTTLDLPIGSTIRSSENSDAVDGAIAVIDADVLYNSAVLQLGDLVGTYDVKPQDILGKGYPISKRGRTTELTHSFITRLDYSGQRGDGWVFRNQLYVSPGFAEPGDSGAVFVDASRRVVGLLWGGNDVMTAGSPIQDVLACLDIDVLTAFSGVLQGDADVKKTSIVA